MQDSRLRMMWSPATEAVEAAEVDSSGQVPIINDSAEWGILEGDAYSNGQPLTTTWSDVVDTLIIVMPFFT